VSQGQVRQCQNPPRYIGGQIDKYIAGVHVGMEEVIPKDWVKKISRRVRQQF